MLHRIAILPEHKQSLVPNRAALDFCLFGNPRVFASSALMMICFMRVTACWALSPLRQQHFTKFHKVSFVKAQKAARRRLIGVIHASENVSLRCDFRELCLRE